MDPRVQFVLNVASKQNGSLHINLPETSRTLGISEPHLLRLFHHEVGKPLKRYLRETRMLRAAEMIKRGQHSIKHIASDCGYADLSNFNRDFKLVFAMTPRAFRLQQVATMAQSASGH